MSERRRDLAREVVRGLYPVVDAADGADPRRVLGLARSVAVPGVRILQLRAKRMSDKAHYETASALAALCRSLSILLVINDRADIALAVGAQAVHLGSDDLPLRAARRVLPADVLIGVSTDSPDEAREAAESGADYVAWGACFTTSTKPDAAPQEGVAALARVRAAIPRTPLVAIGGITGTTVRSVAEAGADAFAVIGALRDAADPEAEARALLQRWNER